MRFGEVWQRRIEFQGATIGRQRGGRVAAGLGERAAQRIRPCVLGVEGERPIDERTRAIAVAEATFDVSQVPMQEAAVGRRLERAPVVIACLLEAIAGQRRLRGGDVALHGPEAQHLDAPQGDGLIGHALEHRQVRLEGLAFTSELDEGLTAADKRGHVRRPAACEHAIEPLQRIGVQVLRESREAQRRLRRVRLRRLLQEVAKRTLGALGIARLQLHPGPLMLLRQHLLAREIGCQARLRVIRVALASRCHDRRRHRPAAAASHAEKHDRRHHPAANRTHHSDSPSCNRCISRRGTSASMLTRSPSASWLSTRATRYRRSIASRSSGRA